MSGGPWKQSIRSAMNQRPSDSRCRTKCAERTLFARVSTGDRGAMDELYIRYFARLAKFFQNMTLAADVVEELINDTMLEVWKSKRVNSHESFRLARNHEIGLLPCTTILRRSRGR